MADKQHEHNCNCDHKHEYNAKKMSKYEEALSKYEIDIDDNVVKENVKRIIAEKVHENDTTEVKTGTFGADMKVELLNDGPVTICMDTKNKE